jgi:enamine deaminase RidA (YjgF/YER057c/UK114 family)
MLTMLNPGGNAPQAPYSHGALATNATRTLYIAGQVGVDAAGRMGAESASRRRSPWPTSMPCWRKPG